MKIALIGNEYEQQFPLFGYGGIEVGVETLAKGLHRNNADFFAVCPKRDKEYDDPFSVIETEELPAKITKRNPHYFATEVKKILKDLKPDVIWSQSNWSADTLHDLNIPLICTFHDSCEKQFGWIRNYKNVKYRFVSNFQFNNWATEAWEKEKSFVCFSGLGDEEYFQDLDEGYYLWCAGLRWGLKAKGLDIFLRLAGVNRDKQFKIYGAGNKEIEDLLLDHCRMNSNLFYGGELKRGENHEKVFARAKRFVMPTQLPEALGRTILESLSKGVPVIGSANGAAPELIKDFGFCSNDFDKLNEALNLDVDRAGAFQYSKKFHVDEEIKIMMKQSLF